MTALDKLNKDQLKKVGIVALCGVFALGIIATASVVRQQKSLDTRSSASTATPANPTISLQPIDDTYITPDKVTPLGADPTLVVENVGGVAKSKTYIKYNLYPLLNKKVISVKLRVHVREFAANTKVNIQFIDSYNNWGQETLTNTNKPPFDDFIYVGQGTPTVKGLNTFDLTNEKALQLLGFSLGNYMTVGMDIAPNAGKVVLSSTESTLIPSYYPLLQIEYQNIAPTPTSVTKTITSRISQSSDDAEIHLTTPVNTLGNQLSILNYTGQQSDKLGLRFNTISIPKGSKISKANIEFTSATNVSSVTNYTIYSVYTDNSLTFGPIVSGQPQGFSPTSITALGKSVDWKIDTPWTTSSTYSTPDLSTIIQPIIDKSGWLTGNSMNLVIWNTGSTGTARQAWSRDGDPLKAPKLTIEYTEPVSITATTAAPKPVVTLTTPSATGLTWKIGTTYNVQWNVTYPTGATANATNTKTMLYLFKVNADNTQSAVGSLTYEATANAGANQFAWTINNSSTYLPGITSGGKYIIEATLLDSAKPNDIRYGSDKSDNPFIIQ